MDSAGRRQYLYHEEWRRRQDREKYDRVVEFSTFLPKIREVTRAALAQRDFTRDRVLAAGLRLIDLGLFRVGNDEYAENNESYGVSTLLREHVTCSRRKVVFRFPGKGGQHNEIELRETGVCRVVRGLHRHRGRGEKLLAFRDRGSWYEVTSDDLNAYLKEIAGDRYSVKDFRTWHATVLAAVGLAVSSEVSEEDEAAVRRAEARVCKEVAGYLRNTPAVARASYIDPRVFTLFEKGVTVRDRLPELGKQTDLGDLSTEGPVEEAVRELLTEV
ncbi:DNA topoisomerase IB [Thermobifida halotolerans]|nr:DNA topoisomerase IB [Thermobifida halotolerans]